LLITRSLLPEGGLRSEAPWCQESPGNPIFPESSPNVMPGNPYYRSREWDVLRAKVIARSGGRCEVPGCKKPGKVVDHIDRRVPGIDINESGLRHLCRDHDNQVKESRTGERRRGGNFIIRGCDDDGWPLDPSRS
jgi:hypothetical protein